MEKVSENIFSIFNIVYLGLSSIGKANKVTNKWVLKVKDFFRQVNGYALMWPMNSIWLIGKQLSLLEPKLVCLNLMLV